MKFCLLLLCCLNQSTVGQKMQPFVKTGISGSQLGLEVIAVTLLSHLSFSRRSLPKCMFLTLSYTYQPTLGPSET